MGARRTTSRVAEFTSYLLSAPTPFPLEGWFFWLLRGIDGIQHAAVVSVRPISNDLAQDMALYTTGVGPPPPWKSTWGQAGRLPHYRAFR